LIRKVPLILNVWTPNIDLKKDVIKSASLWVKLHHVSIVAYSDIRLSLITTQLGRPLMLDTYTSNMCISSWGKNTYAMTPPRCVSCKVFDHNNDKCPKNHTVVVNAMKTGDGFTTVTRKKKKPVQKHKQIEANSFGALTIDDELDTNRTNILNDDSDDEGVDEESTFSSSRMDIAMREFKECVDNIEVLDVPSTGLQYTWNQKPRGLDVCLNDQNALHMVRSVTDREVKDAIFSMGDDKSPGPDGYTAAFFKDAWLIVGDEVTKAICEFFVNGRSISDNILLTQELMHNYHLDRGTPRCAFKVDIQKAYDTVDWVFLRKILIGFGFHDRMIAWIMECVVMTSYSISINGNLHGYFQGKRGFRQGDPLSPYLFTLVMEVLTLI
nr:RNA-directed DNA polymerase, eukaryota, reverse transcriptase zinc-binding domain protein [Tanacetum cinerariifolium]